MRYTTYSRYLPELADTINLQGLLDQLADFLLQSGFAGGPYSHPFWGEFGEDDPDRSLDALRQAILQALRKHDFNRTETAKALGISRRALIYKLQRFRKLGFEIDPPSGAPSS